MSTPKLAAGPVPFARLDAALAQVAFEDSHGLEFEVDLYGAVLAVLAADGSPSLPLGRFGAHLRSRGYVKRRAAGSRSIAGLVLLDPPDAP